MTRTLTPSTTFLITWRYTDAMSIGPDVPTPRTENTTCAVGSEGRESVAREPFDECTVLPFNLATDFMKKVTNAVETAHQPCEAPPVASVGRRGYRRAGMAHRSWSVRF
jgi:hypothetical protein